MTAVSAGTIESATLGYPFEVYRAAVREGVEVEWRCEFCKHPNADITMEDVGSVSLLDPPPTETSLEDSAVGPDLLPQQLHETTTETTYHAMDSPQAVATRRLPPRMSVPLDASAVEKGMRNNIQYNTI